MVLYFKWSSMMCLLISAEILANLQHWFEGNRIAYCLHLNGQALLNYGIEKLLCEKSSKIGSSRKKAKVNVDSFVSLFVHKTNRVKSKRCDICIWSCFRPFRLFINVIFPFHQIYDMLRVWLVCHDAWAYVCQQLTLSLPLSLCFILSFDFECTLFKITNAIKWKNGQPNTADENVNGVNIMAISSKSILNVCLNKFNSHVTSACAQVTKQACTFILLNVCICVCVCDVRMCIFFRMIEGHKTQNKLNEINKENQSEEARGFVTLNNIFTFWLYDSTRLFALSHTICIHSIWLSTQSHAQISSCSVKKPQRQQKGEKLNPLERAKKKNKNVTERQDFKCIRQ